MRLHCLGFIAAVGLLAVAADGSALRTYKNANWGFSVALPSSVRYETNRPPNPNHGFQVYVSQDAFVWVNADLSDDATLSEVAETEKAFWVGQGCGDARMAQVQLGGRSAEQIQLDCPVVLRQNKVKRVMLIVSLEAPPEIGDTAYTIGVTYLHGGKDEQSALRIFDTIRQGFRVNASVPEERNSRRSNR